MILDNYAAHKHPKVLAFTPTSGYPKPFVWTKPVDQILVRLNRLNASVH